MSRTWKMLPRGYVGWGDIEEIAYLSTQENVKKITADIGNCTGERQSINH
jgi:hypothetical protein